MPIRGVSRIVSKLEFYNPIWSDRGRIVVFTPGTVRISQLGPPSPPALSPGWGGAQKGMRQLQVSPAGVTGDHGGSGWRSTAHGTPALQPRHAQGFVQSPSGGFELLFVSSFLIRGVV